MNHEIECSTEKPMIRVRLDMGLSEAEDLLSLIDVGRQVYAPEALGYADLVAQMLSRSIDQCKQQEEFYARL